MIQQRTHEKDRRKKKEGEKEEKKKNGSLSQIEAMGLSNLSAWVALVLLWR